MAAITTERLVLREFRKDDWRAVHEYGSDPDVVRYLPWGPDTEQDTREFIQRAIAQQAHDPRHKFDLAVELRGEGRLIGGCGIRVSSPKDREAWIGYVLNRAFWGRGYGTEAAGALLGFGFGAVGLHRIVATCDPRNAASARLLEKIGMRREGHLRQHMRAGGSWRDSFLYAVLEDEWEQH